MPANQNFPSLGSQKVVDVWTPALQGLLDEGSLFVATNTTIGTAIATTTSVVDAANSGATSAQTRPVAIIYNGNAPLSGKVIYPLTWNWMLSQVPTSATSWRLGLWLEPVGSNAYSSGGSAITPVAMNHTLSSPPASRASIYFGAITANATTAGGGRGPSARSGIGSVRRRIRRGRARQQGLRLAEHRPGVVVRDQLLRLLERRPAAGRDALRLQRLGAAVRGLDQEEVAATVGCGPWASSSG